MLSYVINLDRSPERLARFQAQAETAGMVVERLPGVDGSALSDAQVASALARRFQFQPLNRGELGVFLSHREAWRRLVVSGERLAAIFEDDAVLAPGLGLLLAEGDFETLPFEIIKLETGLRPVALSGKSHAIGTHHAVSELASWHGGTAGYVVTRGGAERLLGLTDPIADTVDQVMFHPFSAIRRRLSVGQIDPAPVIQHQRLAGPAQPGMASMTVPDRRRRGLFRYGPVRDLQRSLRKVGEAMQVYQAGLRGTRKVVPFEGEA